MISLGELTWIWILLALFLVIGLFVHERTGSRLGGVLVLPLLLVYALIDLSVLVVFATGTLVATLVGGWFYSKQLYYGRRLLYVFLLSGLTASFVLIPLVEPDVGTIVMALLPGLFAYNLHREGRYLEGVSTFMIWFGVLLTVITVIVWLLTDADAWEKLSRWTTGGLGAMEATIAPLSPSLGAAIGDFGSTMHQYAEGAVTTASAWWHHAVMPRIDATSASLASVFHSATGLTLASGVTFIALAAAHGEGAAE